MRRSLVVAALAIAAVVAVGLIAAISSSEPDGLERVAADLRIAAPAESHNPDQSPLEDYSVGGGAGLIPKVLAALIGVVITALVAWVLFVIVVRGRRRRGASQ